MRWTFDDIYPKRVFHHPEPGKVDLLRTMPLLDSAANAGTPVRLCQKHGWIMRGGV